MVSEFGSAPGLNDGAVLKHRDGVRENVNPEFATRYGRSRWIGDGRGLARVHHQNIVART